MNCTTDRRHTIDLEELAAGDVTTWCGQVLIVLTDPVEWRGELVVQADLGGTLVSITQGVGDEAQIYRVREGRRGMRLWVGAVG